MKQKNKRTEERLPQDIVDLLCFVTEKQEANHTVIKMLSEEYTTNEVVLSRLAGQQDVFILIKQFIYDI